MKHLIYTLLQVLFAGTLSAQLNLPVFDKKNVKGGEISGSYVAHGNFLKNNPRFIQEGIYNFNKDEIIPSPMGLDYDGYFFMNSFDQDMFPATLANSRDSIKNTGRLLIQFTCSEPGVQFHLSKDNYIYNKFDVEYPDLFNLRADVKAEYESNNIWYKKTLSDILQEKGASGFLFSDLADVSFTADSLSDKDIVFEFQYVQSNVWMQSKTSDKFPSHSLYQLQVKEVSGKVLKRYGQAIFFEGSCSKFTRPKNIEYFIYTNTFPQAARSLLCQFLNDKELRTSIGNKQSQIRKFENNNQLYKSLMYFKSKLNNLKSRKMQLVNIGGSVGVKLAIMEGGIEGVKEANQQQAAINSMTGNDVTGAFAGLISNAILKGGQKKEMDKNRRLTVILEQKIKEVKAEEQALLKGLSEYVMQPYELERLLNDKNNLDSSLNSLMAETVKQSSNVSANLNNVYKTLNNTYLSNIQMGLGNMVPAAETSAISNGVAAGQGQQGADACSKKSETEWKATAEYRKCKEQGVVNTSQASCERAKAKLIEITLKNCGSKLPPNEVAALQKARQSLLQTAAEMDKGAFKMR